MDMSPYIYRDIDIDIQSLDIYISKNTFEKPKSIHVEWKIKWNGSFSYQNGSKPDVRKSLEWK